VRRFSDDDQVAGPKRGQTMLRAWNRLTVCAIALVACLHFSLPALACTVSWLAPVDGD
jgi:hypothetical protein